jgi:hypothetical protein
MVTFDEKGHLYPYEVIEMTMIEFEQEFVGNSDDKAHRKRLFINYLRFIEDFRAAFGGRFFQWINGSFTTTKLLPGDIDLVSFIDYDHFVKNAAVFNHFAMKGKELYNVDAHFATTASWRHRYYQKCQDDERYWKNIFGFSRRDENLERHPKGIVKLKF